MSSARRQYPFHLIEPKWQARWDHEQTFRAWNPGEDIPADHPFRKRHPAALPPKYYILDMFPYPSGAGLHVGHPEGYTATDILARYRRALGFNVLHPMGWDAFGLPAEQYAIKTGQHPRKTTEANIATFKRQIKSLGFSYDWSREVDTTDPNYFKWTQWIFLKIYNSWFNPATSKAEPIETLTYPPELRSDEEKRAYRDSKRLAFVSEAPVNWCPELGTVLANEEVIDGKSEVGGYPVIRKPMRQWMLRITAYAERLLNDLDSIDWSHSLKEMQRNWIGRSEGAEVIFRLADSEKSITVFTTRPDTLWGATYMVLSPEHKLVDEITTPEYRAEVEKYRAYAASKSDLERTELAKEKTGVFTGAYAINLANNERIPIWIADYVLISYGTGAIMAVPAHDTRDLEFAEKFSLTVIKVVEPPDGKDWRGFVDDGTSVNSSNPEISLNGLPTPEAKRKITAWLESKGLGKKTINYKLRDWLFSRQRYWGEPFPIVWKNGHHEALPESALPVLPPELQDYKPTASGEPPLARAKEWVNLPDGSTRETNTMPQWAGSCWYYLRFIDAQNPASLCDAKAERYWMGTGGSSATPGIDLYVGGTEHAVLHLLYSRFWHKVLYDLGYVSTPEPFFKLVNQGLILGEDNQKMSKSRGNVIPVDAPVKDFGTDALRLFEMFIGPLEMVKPWSTRGVEGVYRFLGRVWRLFVDEQSETELEQRLTTEQPGPELLDIIRLNPAIQDVTATPVQLKTLHACIRKVTEDLDGLRFNTAISALMVFVNEAMTWETRPRSVMRDFLILLQPFAPHLAEELFSRLYLKSELRLPYIPWPKFDPALLVEDMLVIAVQVNGKLRDTIVVPANPTQEEIEAAALKAEKAQPFLAGKIVKKIIVVPKRLVNIVVA
ncbi:MAG: leucine--tRNA ligase [Verrucomicrobia subdivision 3 bacterium]|nr:leucine--tRNA ligase [Limisphaerales bacterium]